MKPRRISPARQLSLPKARLWGISLLTALGAFVAWTAPASAQDDWAFRPPTSTGPAVGQRIPAFRAPDQNGRVQDFNSIKGPKGAALYFMRSVDW